MDVETTVEYQYGKQARIAGQTDKTCPYPCGGFNDSRYRWLRGFWNEHVEMFLRQLDAKTPKPEGVKRRR
jgi:ribosome modulation factor